MAKQNPVEVSVKVIGIGLRYKRNNLFLSFFGSNYRIFRNTKQFRNIVYTNLFACAGFYLLFYDRKTTI